MNMNYRVVPLWYLWFLFDQYLWLLNEHCINVLTECTIYIAQGVLSHGHARIGVSTPTHLALPPHPSTLLCQQENTLRLSQKGMCEAPAEPQMCPSELARECFLAVSKVCGSSWAMRAPFWTSQGMRLIRKGACATQLLSRACAVFSQPDKPWGWLWRAHMQVQASHTCALCS